MDGLPRLLSRFKTALVAINQQKVKDKLAADFEKVVVDAEAFAHIAVGKREKRQKARAAHLQKLRDE